MYGTGSKPLIAGVTSELEAVFLKNQQYWEINNLEVTNSSPLPFDRDWQNPRGQRRGVYILNEEAGILNHIYIKNLNIHDVDGSYTTRSGGIIVDSVGSNTPSAFNDILIDGNTLTDVDAYGIYIGSNCILRYGMGDLWPWVPKPYGPWTPSTNVKISNNTVLRAATGGIAWNVTDGAVVERNTVGQATYLATNASIWWAYADNNLVQFNESFASVNGARTATASTWMRATSVRWSNTITATTTPAGSCFLSTIPITPSTRSCDTTSAKMTGKASSVTAARSITSIITTIRFM
ncbi:hypothetical protein CM49_06570 [Paenibacillus sp. P1XP2]|nr:hypothetical protein CM49_06570 [Paenibacillus sp. P1XP2]